jgi:octaprenyl-diphosphate synthase
MLQEAVKTVTSSRVLSRLGRLSAGRGFHALASRLLSLSDFVDEDLERIEASLASLEMPDALIGRGAGHLMDLGGKRLRPLCVALASRMGSGFDSSALDLAVAVELVHNATLLHDDVVDLADSRRGVATARTEFGNAASIFAGDWLLIEALRRVRAAGLPGLLDSLLDTIEEMILAESVQLEHRGRLEADRAAYLEVAEGKTAALFRWAMAAGGQAGGLPPAQCRQLSEYGRHLGVAFQVIDDLLDLTGDAAATGKNLFTDLRDGMVTYPLILAMEAKPELRLVLQQALANSSGTSGEATGPQGSEEEARWQQVVNLVRGSGAVEASRDYARQRCERAVQNLHGLPDGRPRRTLRNVAESTVHRER